MTVATYPEIRDFDPARCTGGAEYVPEKGEWPVEFIETCLKHVKNSVGALAGDPLILEPWQRDVTRTIFGWVRPDGTRRFRHVYVEVPRKNGKTTWLAALTNYVLFADGEEGAECYCAASDADQARLLYSIAAEMIRKNPRLDGNCKIRDSVNRIIYKTSYVRAIPADAGGSHGFNSHLNCCDELHAWHGATKAEFYDVLETGTAARRQPLHIDITTAGYDRTSKCWKQRDYAVKVRDGVIDDPTWLPVIYAADEADDWTSEETWVTANPNLGKSVSLEYLREKCRKAKKEPAFENTFRRLHLNQWTSQETRWLKMSDWRGCAVGEAIPEKAMIGLGLDLSTTTDLTALALVEERGDGYRVEWRFWLPEGRIDELERRESQPYRKWIDQGYLQTMPGMAIDQRWIKEEIGQIDARYLVGALCYDPWNAQQLATEVEEYYGWPVVKCRQGVATMSAPAKELERAVISGVLDHGDNPIAAWHAESVSVKMDDNGNMKPVRPDKSEHGKKIDGIAAAIMGILACGTFDSSGSIYEQPGNLFL